MNKKTIFWAGILLILCALYFQFSLLPIGCEKVNVARVIDGDTLVLTNGLRVRLMGINTPEKSFELSEDAQKFLEKEVLDKDICVESYGGDRYRRVLGYVFVGFKNINLEILKEGLGSLYYYENDKYFNSMKRAESQARKKEKGIWKKSSNFDCLNLVDLIYDIENESLILENNCNLTLNLVIKDDATHIYKREVKVGIFEEQFSHIFNNDGDSLYVWDEEGLVEFWRY